MDIGADLRRARIARERSIEDVSRTTKISSSVLRAIENDDFEKVPGGLFTRGYLRAYARDVGLDPEEMVRRYRAEFEPPPPSASEQAASQPVVSQVKPIDPEDEAVRTRRGQLVELGVILLVVGACFAFLRQPQPSPEVAAQVAPPPTAVSKSENPVGTSGRNGVAPTELKVDLHPTGPCWVEATADGERVVAKLMNAGERQAMTVREAMTLRVGDPSVFAFSIDGRAGRPFGRAGQPETIQITRLNYDTFVEPRR